MTSRTEYTDSLGDAAGSGAAGYCDFSSRTQVEMVGPDRAKVLHGLCTNDIQRLTPGQGCEAFLTNVQGKTIGFVYVFCLDDSLVLETVSGQSQHLVDSIDRYVIREDVEVIDRTGQWSEVLLRGEPAVGLLGPLADFSLPTEVLGTTRGLVSGLEAVVHRVAFCTPSDYFVRVQTADRPLLIEALESAGAVALQPQAVEMGRIEMGTPLFGDDITEENLPQEVNRDSLTISFNKGCYLGQETVARIDALGRVNRKLVRLCFAGELVPPPGACIRAGWQAAGDHHVVLLLGKIWRPPGVGLCASRSGAGRQRAGDGIWRGNGYRRVVAL